MVHPDSHRISRVPQYSGNPKRDCSVFAYRAVTFCGVLFQDISANRQLCNSPTGLPPGLSVPTTPMLQRRQAVTQHRFRLFPFRSPLLRESLLLSFPPGTEMFQFPGLASNRLYIQRQITGYDPGWVVPFGNPRVEGCLHLTAAYRSLPRPSSPLRA